MEKNSKYLQEKMKLNKVDPNAKESNKKKNAGCIQPSMRFKPRTEIERLFESINQYSYGRVNRNIVDEQIKSMEVKKPKKQQNEEKVDEEVALLYKKEHIKSEDNNFKSTKKSEPNGTLQKLYSKISSGDKKKVDNPYAKLIMKDLHFKTHFKAASMFANKLDRGYDDYKTIKNSNSNLNVIKSRNFFDDIDQEENEINLRGCLSNCNLLKSDTLSESSKDEENELYNININPLAAHPHKETENISKETLEYLNKISVPDNLMHLIKRNVPPPQDKGKNFKHTLKMSLKKPRVSSSMDKLSILRNNPMTFFENLKNLDVGLEVEAVKKDNETIRIGNDVYLRREVDKISKNVLFNCNYLNHKSPHNNHRLKKLTGKLSITNGLTLDQFVKKYNIPK